MADNTTQTAANNIATDDIAGVHYQIFKHAFGALDTATLVTSTVGLPSNLVQANGNALLAGNGVTGTGSIRVTIASDNTAFSVNAVPPTLTKGTQGSTGFSTQDLKDAGRSVRVLTAEFTHAQTAETILTMTNSVNGATTTSNTSHGLTSGKRLRMQTAFLETEMLGTGTTPIRSYLRCRVNTAGAATATSALQWILACGVTSAVVKASEWANLEFPDGYELLGDGTLQYCFTLETPDFVTTTATGRSKITIIMYEY